jgi:hypothetical protein
MMARTIEGAGWALHIGDCRQVLPTLPAQSAAAGLWDPPSGLGFMGLDWDLRAAQIFEAFLIECFVAALRVLQAGAWVAVWAHPTTSHWVGTALEKAGYIIESKCPWINAEGKPPTSAGRLAAGHEQWIIARTPGPRRDLSLRLWADAMGGRHPRALVLGGGAGATLDAVIGRRRSGAMTHRPADRAGGRHTYGASKASPASIAASDGGASRYFLNEAQLLAVYAARARHRHRALGPGGAISEHPTPKSIELILPLCDLVAGEEAPEGPVLDIFAGTCSTGEAALMLGRPFIGIELGLDPRWPVEGEQRLRNVERDQEAKRT